MSDTSGSRKAIVEGRGAFFFPLLFKFGVSIEYLVVVKDCESLSICHCPLQGPKNNLCFSKVIPNFDRLFISRSRVHKFLIEGHNRPHRVWFGHKPKLGAGIVEHKVPSFLEFYLIFRYLFPLADILLLHPFIQVQGSHVHGCNVDHTQIGNHVPYRLRIEEKFVMLVVLFSHIEVCSDKPDHKCVHKIVEELPHILFVLGNHGSLVFSRYFSSKPQNFIKFYFPHYFFEGDHLVLFHDAELASLFNELS